MKSNYVIEDPGEEAGQRTSADTRLRALQPDRGSLPARLLSPPSSSEHSGLADGNLEACMVFESYHRLEGRFFFHGKIKLHKPCAPTSQLHPTRQRNR